jgi:hypothetical protein
MFGSTWSGSSVPTSTSSTKRFSGGSDCPNRAVATTRLRASSTVHAVTPHHGVSFAAEEAVGSNSNQYRIREVMAPTDSHSRTTCPRTPVGGAISGRWEEPSVSHSRTELSAPESFFLRTDQRWIHCASTNDSYVSAGERAPHWLRLCHTRRQRTTEAGNDCRSTGVSRVDQLGQRRKSMAGGSQRPPHSDNCSCRRCLYGHYPSRELHVHPSGKVGSPRVSVGP